MLLEFPTDEFTKRWFEEWAEESWSWATGLLNFLLQHQPESAWLLINQLVSAAEDDDELRCVAAGPLEDLLAAYGPQFVERVEHEAKSSERFRTCLAGLWGHARFESSIYERVRRSLARQQE